MRRPPRTPIAALLVAITLTAMAAPAALAAVVPAGVQAGTPTQAASTTHAATHGGGAPCNVGIPVIGGAVSTLTNAACDVGSTIASGVGSIVSGVGNSILDAVASWLIGAATAITSFVAAQMTATTTPALQSSWFEAQFAPIAALGAALALLVTLVALGSAALRRSPDALAATVVAVIRAGFGTGVIVALTAIGLGIADAISADIIRSSPHAFWSTVATAWAQHGFGGFGSSALAALIALVEVFGALLVWLELIVRGAVIYIAVLFFPVALAASIWPPLAGWTGRLGRLLLLFVMLKPITLIVLSLAGNAAASGLSFSAGASASVGTILAAVVIFALAAFAPWALMYLLSADAESAWTGGALRAGAGGAVAGTQGRSVRNGGGLANLHSSSAGGGGGTNAGGGPNGGGRGGGGSGGGTPQPPSGGSSGAQAQTGSGGTAAGSNGGSAAAAGVIGGGSVAAAAGMQRAASRAGGAIAAADGSSGAPGHAPHGSGASSGGSKGGGAERDTAGNGHPGRGGAQREGSGAEVLQFGARTGRPRTDTGSLSAQRSSGRSTGAPGRSDRTTPAGSRPRGPAGPPAGPGEGRT
jgi:hypothetical protein